MKASDEYLVKILDHARVSRPAREHARGGDGRFTGRWAPPHGGLPPEELQLLRGKRTPDPAGLLKTPRPVPQAGAETAPSSRTSTSCPTLAGLPRRARPAAPGPTGRGSITPTRSCAGRPGHPRTYTVLYLRRLASPGRVTGPYPKAAETISSAIREHRYKDRPVLRRQRESAAPSGRCMTSSGTHSSGQTWRTSTTGVLPGSKSGSTSG